MITLKNFKKLHYEIQLHCLYGSGVNLELYRTVNEMEVVLYALGNFYVEIYFDNGITKVLELKAFRSVNRLSPYLESIDISEIQDFLGKMNC